MKKNFLKKSLLTAALTMSVLATGANLACADATITDGSSLNTFVTSGSGIGTVTANFSDMTGQMNVNNTPKTLTGDAINRTITGNGQFYMSAGSKLNVENLTFDGIIHDQPDNPYGVFNTVTNIDYIGTTEGRVVFKDNQAKYGGVISNAVNGNIKEIYADFTGNKATVYGGAIYNNGSAGITDINATFTGNYAKSTSSEAYGGAIYNRATITNINADFTDNYTKSTSGNSQGGAIYNQDTITDINGTFTDNYTKSTSGNSQGGAIYNYASVSITTSGITEKTVETKIDKITGDFTGNYVEAVQGLAKGGAITNYAYAKTAGKVDSGAKATANAKINNITADFTNNHAKSETAEAYGGAIANIMDVSQVDETTATATPTIGSITGTFTGNYAEAISGYALGGAIYNQGTITDINGKFTGNYAKSASGSAEGGAIYNQNTIGDTTDLTKGGIGTADNHVQFVNNGIKTENEIQTTVTIKGGAIANVAEIDDFTSEITNIYADFTGNKATWSGGAIYNFLAASLTNAAAKIDNINGKFENNAVTSTSGYALGGAIYNQGTITDINGTFTGNYAETTAGSVTGEGGAIYNQDTIGDTTDLTKGGIGTADNHVQFVNNGIKTENETQTTVTHNGGAIANVADDNNTTTEITNIYADFTGNKATRSGGAIYNYANTDDYTGVVAKIDNINGKFENNAVTNTKGNAMGGAIWNNGTISNINGTFKDNHTKSTSTYAQGGAIYNNAGTITNINADFTGNYTEGNNTKGGAIYNYKGIIGDTADPTKGGIGTAKTHAQFIGNGVKTENETQTTVTKYGGAIYNEGTKDQTAQITNIYADFTDNKVTTSGGAIYNSKGTITNIYADFKENSSANEGGAIYNGSKSNITNIIADFTKNNATAEGSKTCGGAIANYGTIANINANFTGNYAEATSSSVYGGAIYNSGTITDINDTTFTDNYAKSASGNAKGGAIYNSDTITLNDAVFKNNYVISGTIKKYNDIQNDAGTINITGNVSMTGGIEGNGTTNINGGTLTLLHATDEQGTDKGLAKLEQSTVNINGGTLSILNGVAGDKLTISNLGVETGKTANFKFDLDPANGKSDMFYISNDGAGKNIALTDIKMLSDVASTGGYVKITWAKENQDTPLSTWTDTTGTLYSATKDYFYTLTKHPTVVGALRIDIDADGKKLISDLDLPTVVQATGDNQKYEKIWYYKLADNITLAGKSLGSLGGTGRELTIDGQGHTLDGNGMQGITVKNGQTFALDNITMKNFAKEATGSYPQGAVIYNESGTISSIKNVTFENNKITQIGTDAKLINGAAIANLIGTIGDISGSFKNNSVEGAWSGGGAVWNMGNITGEISSNFTGNYVKSTGTVSDPEFGEPEAYGGAIANVVMGSIKSITGNFSKNYAEATKNAYGGAIYNKSMSLDPDIAMVAKIDSIGKILTRAQFSDNYVKSTDGGNAHGGAIWNAGTINEIYADFEGNKAISNSGHAQGGAIYNSNGIRNISGTFTNNSVTGTTSAQGGAIYNSNGIGNVSATFTNNSVTGTTYAAGGAIANTGMMGISDSSFSGNTVNGKPNDINNVGVIVFTGTNTLEGGITNTSMAPGSNDSTAGYIGIGDGKTPTKVTLGNNATLAQNTVVVSQNAMLALGTKAAANLGNGVNKFVSSGGTLNIQNSSLDSLSFNNLVLLGDLNMMVDADLRAGRMDTVEADTYTGSGNIIVSNIKLLSDMDLDTTKSELQFTSSLKDKVSYGGDKTVAYSNLYKYNVGYDNKTGMFSFSKEGGTASFNPALFAASVAQQGMYLTQINTYEQAFANMDQTMLMTNAERTAWKNANKYAAEGAGNGIITYSPNQFPEEGKGVYFRPFASFENVNLNNGPKAGNISYGGLVGGDSDLITFKAPLLGNVDMIWGAYAGYNGSHQTYEGNGIYQNGGTLGLNSAFYWKNFFAGLTANVGASGAEASTMLGKENFTSLATGIAGKLGYNWELFEGKFIIQPSIMGSYSFIKTFNYRNAAGLDVNSDPLNAMQIVPGLKFIGNLPHGWQPYIGVQMIWNLLDKTKFSIQDISLPEMSVDPYVQYGVGLQKRWGDRFTGFGQVMMRNGGRTGVSLNAGFRYELGKKGEKSNSKAGVRHSDERNISLSATK